MSKNWSPVITLILFVKSKVLPVCKLLLRYRDYSHCEKSPKSVTKSQSKFFKPQGGPSAALGLEKLAQRLWHKFWRLFAMTIIPISQEQFTHRQNFRFHKQNQSDYWRPISPNSFDKTPSPMPFSMNDRQTTINNLYFFRCTLRQKLLV